MDAECRAWLGPALDSFEYVPSDIADRVLGPPPGPDTLGDARRDALILAREVGRLQTGHPVDTRWALAYLELLAEDALGVVAWRLDEEQCLPAILAVLDRARQETRRGKAREDEEVAVQTGAPFDVIDPPEVRRLMDRIITRIRFRETLFPDYRSDL